MSVFTGFIATANRLISKYGQDVSWSKDELAPIDQTKPWLGNTNVPTLYVPRVCFVPASGNTFGMERYRAQIEAGEISLFGLMAPQDFEPELSDTVIRDGSPLIIKWIDTLKPADEVVIYVLGIV